MNKKQVNLELINNFYEKNFIKYKFHNKTLAWKSKKEQIIRFEKLTSFIDKKKISINDYGCGFGDLFFFLKKKKFFIKEYCGYELSESIFNKVNNRFKTLEEKIFLINSENINKKMDYSFASGTFNIKMRNSDKNWSNFIKKKIKEMNAYSKKGFSFNLLSTYVDYKKEDLYYGDPNYWFDFCKINFSKKINLIHDYDLWEWTIIVKK